MHIMHLKSDNKEIIHLKSDNKEIMINDETWSYETTS